MWTTDELGMAVWRDDQSVWYLDARGGAHGVGVVATEDDDPNAFEKSGRYVSLSAVDHDFLPAAGEQYVRGDEWHVNYPQGDGSYALRLAFTPIETAKDLLVLEATISLQTNLLDTHPRIDLNSTCLQVGSFVSSDQSDSEQVPVSEAPPISIAASKDHCTSILLGPHDRPFTTRHSTKSLLRLRLFGEFLEKGVIRKARPWIVISRSGVPLSLDQHEVWWKELCASPLPLTP